MNRWPLALLCLICTATTLEAKQPRSQSTRQSFVRTAPCPATGLPKMPCPGYIIDHVVPLCAGGKDQPDNMQWQTVEAAKLKDRVERRMCNPKDRKIDFPS